MVQKDRDNSRESSPDSEGSIIPAAQGEILLYQTEDGRTRVECRFQDETIWLSQALMSELYQKDVRTINEHLKSIYSEGELDPEATIRKFRIVRQEGNRQVTRTIKALEDAAKNLPGRTVGKRKEGKSKR